MSRTASDAAPRVRAPLWLVAAALAAAWPAAPLAAQDAAAPAAATQIRSSEISMSRNRTELQLELADGRTLEFEIGEGRVTLNGESLGSAPRGGRLDDAWRELLGRAIDAAPADLAQLLIDWDAPGDGAAARLDAALETALRPGSTAADLEALAPRVSVDAQQADSRTSDSIEVLEAEINRLRNELRGETRDRYIDRGRADGPPWSRPFRHIANGIAGIFSIMIGYTVLFGIGIAVIFFGGRRYIEGVADTARHQTLRSLLVGLAAACLILPAFVLGIIALAISIVGIPALLAWIPLFPVAAVLALLLGYISVAHAAGEALAERRFYATDWFRRGNSYYFIMTGLGLLVAFFLAGHVVSMAGPWFGFFEGMLMLLGCVVTMAALAIGFGAVLISRAGTRPVAGAEPDLFSDEPAI